MGVVRNWWLCVCLLWSSALVAGPVMSHPDVSLGSNPIRNFSGQLVSGEENVLLVVPAGQAFIITTMMQEGVNVRLKANDSVVLARWDPAENYFSRGISRIPVGEGQSLKVENAGPWNERYYLEGYFASAAGPHQAVMGSVPEESPPTAVFTNERDQPFIVRTMLLSSSFCTAYRDGEPVVWRQILGSGDSARNDNAFSNRKASLLVPSGATLQVTSTEVVTECEYYLEGEYVQP